MPRPILPTPAKHCAHCGAILERKRWANGWMESQALLERRTYCDRECGYAAMRRPSPTKHCAHCGRRLARVRWRNGKLESQALFERRIYCGRVCAYAAARKRRRLIQ